MNPPTPARGPILAAVMVAVGALLTSLFSFVMILQGVSAVPRVYVLPDPLGWAILPHIRPFSLLGMLVALVLLVGLTWLFTRMVVRSAAPGRMAAVFFGTWGAVVIAALISGVVRAPLALTDLGLSPDMGDLLLQQFVTMSTQGATWALYWGWITALVVALVHRASGRTGPQGAEPMQRRFAEYRPVDGQPPYAPPAQQYPPQPYQGPHVPPQPPAV